MIRVLALAAMFALTGCLTTAEVKHRPSQMCAAVGQYYEGFTATGTINSGQTVVGDVRCAMPKTEAEKCHLNAEREIAAAAAKHNDEVVGMKNVAVVVGYTLYVLPGVGLYYMWKDDVEASYAKFRVVDESAHNKCDKAQADVAH